jgi:ABC-type nickel/cobalt efflux system permease component RcnA
MLILGLLLVVVSGAAAAVLIGYNSAGAAETVSAFGRDIASVTLMQAFVAGIVVALVFLLGLWMIVAAGKRSREHRARYREARREARSAAKERDQLADRIRHDEDARADQETVAMPVVGGPGERTTRTDAADADAGRHATQPTDRHQQPVITNIHENQTPTK